MFQPAKVVKITVSNDGKRVAKVSCPNCREVHQHGLGRVDQPLEDFLTHRLSHCVKREPVNYVLTLTEVE